MDADAANHAQICGSSAACRQPWRGRRAGIVHPYTQTRQPMAVRSGHAGGEHAHRRRRNYAGNNRYIGHRRPARAVARRACRAYCTYYYIGHIFHTAFRYRFNRQHFRTVYAGVVYHARRAWHRRHDGFPAYHQGLQSVLCRQSAAYKS